MASAILVYMLVLPAYLRFGFGEEGGGRERKEDMFLLVGVL
jgi:hypothetical protein